MLRTNGACPLFHADELDPLACPKCGGQMKVVAFIEPPQGAVIEKILRHCGLRQPSTPRPPPPVCWGWSDADWFADDEFFDGGFTNGPADDFVQVAPDDSAYFADIDACEVAF